MTYDQVNRHKKPNDCLVKNSVTQGRLESLLGKTNSGGRRRHRSWYLWKFGVAMVTQEQNLALI